MEEAIWHTIDGVTMAARKDGSLYVRWAEKEVELPPHVGCAFTDFIGTTDVLPMLRGGEGTPPARLGACQRDKEPWNE